MNHGTFYYLYSDREAFVRGIVLLNLACDDDAKPHPIEPPFDVLRDVIELYPGAADFPCPGMRKRLIKELNDLEKDPQEGITLTPCGPGDVEPIWKASVVGPLGTPYEGGVFWIDVKIPRDYPFKPPRVQFTTKLLHPNINQNGHVSMSILRESWSPALILRKVVLSLQSLLEDPNPDDSLVPELAHMYKTDRVKYNEQVR
eukprot:PhF_6_TR22710/c0_g1_i1/m.32349/K06689/UBE2D, UBC4, UBC5; ubiquitin-conjugating enzyme E2 D